VRNACHRYHLEIDEKLCFVLMPFADEFQPIYVVIAELTGKNPNLFYEVGLGHALGKKVILLTQNVKDVPFDLRHLRCIVYRDTPPGVKALEERLTGAIEVC
jgi:hypothetical protein